MPKSDGWEKVVENIQLGSDNSPLAATYRSHGNGMMPNIALVPVDEDDKPLASAKTGGGSGGASAQAGGSSSAPQSGLCPNGKSTAQRASAFASEFEGGDSCVAAYAQKFSSDKGGQEEWQIVVSAIPAKKT